MSSVVIIGLLALGVTLATHQVEALDVPTLGVNESMSGADGSADQNNRPEVHNSHPQSEYLPQCYSTTAADPSLGTWRMCEGGEIECSPTHDLETWAHSDMVAGHYKLCRTRWESDHEGEGPLPYWTWEPSTCILDAVDAEKFCRVMAGRKGILFVGDSLSGEMFDTLASILRADFSDHGKGAVNYIGCHGRLFVSSFRNDFLDTRTTEESGGFPSEHCEEPDISASRCNVFADDSILREYDTIVVNAGAHRRRGGVEAYGEMMRNASRFLSASMERLHGDKAILIVRNTVPGHGHSYDRTFNGPVDFDTANNILQDAPQGYGWSSFLDKNKVLEDAFQSASPSWSLLDAYSPTILRADMHGRENDGLHYCIPGPVDHWISLLYNILLVQTTAMGEI